MTETPVRVSPAINRGARHAAYESYDRAFVAALVRSECTHTWRHGHNVHAETGLK